ncbi:MAG: hypothetical protein ACC653_04300 [Gammaproteobacteria bacterium]
MKDSMIEIMIAMMPYMKPFMYFGMAFVVLAIILVLTKMAAKTTENKALRWSLRFVFITAGFFLLAQGMGIILSMPPTINFGDSSKFEFILVSFWQVGLVFLFVALVLKFLGRNKQIKAS